MKTRLLALLLIVVMALGLAASVSAQDSSMCFNLSADDCAVITAASANSSSIQAFNYTVNFTLNADLSSVAAMAGPGTPNKIDVKVNANGAMILEKEAKPPVAATFNLDANADMGTGAQSAKASLVLKDGVAYYQDPASSKWIGMKLADLLKAANLPIPVDSLLSGDLSALSAMANPQTMGAMAGGMNPADLEALMKIPGFIDYKRLPDESLGDAKVSPFALTVDVIPLLSSPEFSKLMQSMSSSDPQAGMAAAMIPMLAQNATLKLTVTQYVGADDKLIHKLAVDGELKLDLSALAAMGASTGSNAAPAMGPITGNVHFDVELSDINSADIKIAAPEGATMASM